MLGLRWSDVDLDKATVSIRQTVVSVHYVIHFSEPKTACGRRTISLDPATVAVLRRHRQAQRDERDMLSGAQRERDLVFAAKDGGPTHPDYFSQTFDRTVKRLKLRRVRLHDYADVRVMLTLIVEAFPHEAMRLHRSA